MELLVVAVITLLLTIATQQLLNCIIFTRKNLPPGPVPLPIVGNLLALGRNPHNSLAKLAKTHGPIMSLRLGQVTTVVISSSALAKQVLQKYDYSFSSRTIPQAVQVRNHHMASLAFLPVAWRWRNLRRICSTNLFTSQKLDMNKDLRARKIQELVDNVQEYSRLGMAVDIGQVAFRTSLNVLSYTIFSLDLIGSGSDQVQEFKEVVRGMMNEAGKPNLSDYFPVLRKIDPQGIRRRMDVYFEKLLNLFNKLIDERIKLRQTEGYTSTNDMLDTLLSIREENCEEMDTRQIKHLFLDLFVAGTDTTSTTVEWAMAELLRNPKTLMKAREELKKSVGLERLLEESDIAQLPYLQAVIKETLRLHTPAPLLLPRKSAADIEISGFTVPKEAQVLVNAWAIGRDPDIWEDPNVFKPERFLELEIDARGHNFELIPFGAGRRICPGLPLATRMLHLMLGSLIHLFDWKLEDGITPESLDMEEKFGLTLQKAQPLKAVPIQAA